MKIINIKSLFIGLLVIGFFGCDQQLELEPAQSISENAALETDANIKAALVGAYDELGVGSLFGGNTLRNSELLGGDGEIQWVGTFVGPREMFTKQMNVDNGDAEGVWIDAYQTINMANNVLSALERVNASDRNTVEGEALFIRGLLYFELVRFYGLPYEAGQTNSQLGVPLVLTPTRAINDGSFVSRNTVEEIYTQVIADLTRAASILPASNSWRATSGAANAILARVYLQQGNYQSALNAANAVIESGEYALLDNYADVFNRDANSSEDIFAIQNTTQDGTNNMNLFWSIPDFGGRDGDIEIFQGHLDLYDPADERLALFFMGNGAMRSGKWNNQFGNVGVVRLAEMYLIRAECNLRLGSSVGASPVDDYNAVHTRAGLPAATDVTLEDVLFERRLELAHEGAKIHDIKRLQQSVGGFAYNANELVFPIPQREMNANPNLDQNPGY
jgi:tetratricopeptide (TPR) repeat protein